MLDENTILTARNVFARATGIPRAVAQHIVSGLPEDVIESIARNNDPTEADRLATVALNPPKQPPPEVHIDEPVDVKLDTELPADGML